MSYGQFLGSLNCLLDRIGGATLSFCKNDTETGRYSARLSDGTKVIARPGSSVVTVRFGSGHQAMINLREMGVLA